MTPFTSGTRSGPTRSHRVGLPLAAVVLAVGALAACSGGGHGPTLERMAIGDGTGLAYAAVAVPLQLTVVGTYSDGTSATLGAGVAWSSSDETVASVDPSGRVSPWRRGDGVIITARDTASGVSATASLSTRDVLLIASGTPVRSATVDTTMTYFHVTGLTPGALYAPRVSAMSDDVDLFVFNDMSMTASKEECYSEKVGKYDESCIARATTTGELWIQVSGEWTEAGAAFSVSVPASPAFTVKGVLSSPSQFPYSAWIEPTSELYRVTGLTAGARYEFKLSQLSADIDVGVYGDVYGYQRLCFSYNSGTAEDACTATVPSTGELYLLISGETSIGGGSYTLGVTPK